MEGSSAVSWLLSVESAIFVIAIGSRHAHNCEGIDHLHFGVLDIRQDLPAVIVQTQHESQIEGRMAVETVKAYGTVRDISPPDIGGRGGVVDFLSF